MELSYLKDKARVTFLIGGLGAGKTELALNLAVWNSKNQDESYLFDLDIVNPFFRVRKLKEEIEAEGVKIVTPDPRVVNGDIPALPGQVFGLIEKSESSIVCDIGGGEPGLRPLGRLKDLAEMRQANVFYVMNPFRPGFITDEERRENFRHFSNLSALQVTHLVANPNLSGDTSKEDFLEGLKIVKDFAKDIDVRFAFTMVDSEMASKFELNSKEAQPEFASINDTPAFSFKRYWSVPWQFGNF